ncbi:UNVERIFIED_CONTAM: hypothetical protein HDU68_009392 [Siphonaria sp. JEL0065]|nr:hypothetical protein HDU68_009392 [Siphonaria sp. JEL0065]
MTMEICVSDLNQNKRRFFISTAAKETKNTALHVTLPLGFLKRGVWLNLCFDLISLVGDSFKGQTFRCLDSIALSGTYRLRKVFTMKLPPPDTTDDYELFNEPITSTLGLDCIPKTLQYGIGIDHITQVINLPRIKAVEKLEMKKNHEELDSAFQSWPMSLKSSLTAAGDGHGPKLAFGTRPTTEVTNSKITALKKQRIRTAKSKDGHGRVVSKSASRTSFRTHDESDTENDPPRDTVTPKPTLPPILEVENTPQPALMAFESIQSFETVNVNDAAQDSDPTKYSVNEIYDLEAQEMMELSNETINAYDSLDLELVGVKLKSLASKKDEAEENESTLDNEIDAFFKAQEEQEEHYNEEEAIGTERQLPDTKQQPANINELLERHFKLSEQLKSDRKFGFRASTDATPRKRKSDLYMKRPYSLDNSLAVESSLMGKIEPLSLPFWPYPVESKSSRETQLTSAVAIVHEYEDIQPEEFSFTVDDIMPQLGESRVASSGERACINVFTPKPPAVQPPTIRHSSAKLCQTPIVVQPQLTSPLVPGFVVVPKSRSAPSATETNGIKLTLNEATDLLQSIIPQSNKLAPVVLPAAIRDVESNVEELAAAAEGMTSKSKDIEDDEEDETLELMYDAETNSYFDPKTGKYYEIEESDNEAEIII